MNAKALIAAGALALALSHGALAQQTARPGDPLAGKTVVVTLVTAEGITLSEDAHGVTNTRTLAFGEEFAPGWVLERPTPMGIAIRNGTIHRVLPQAQQQAAGGASADAGAAAGQVNLSNAVQGERSARTGQVVDRAKLVTAIKAGDVRQAYELGGSAKEVAEAMVGNMSMPRLQEALANGADATFVNMNGNTGVRVSSSVDGRNMNLVIAPPALQGVAPPPDAQVMNPPAIPPGGADTQVSTDGNGNTVVRRTIPLPAPGN